MNKTQSSRLILCASFALSASACSPENGNESAEMARRVSERIVQNSACNPTINVDRSLAVTEVEALTAFTMREMLETLISQGPDPDQDPVAMFAAMSASLGGCAEGEAKKTVGGFQMRCLNGTLGRPGTPQDIDPFGEVAAQNGYFPVGVFNRFDLAPENGETCGEYRIVFARQSGIQNGSITFVRRLINFEAVLPNPHPERGIEGCRPVAEFWAGLSEIDDVSARGQAVHDFFLVGLPEFGPVVHINNYGLSQERGSGQIRSNSFLNHQWSQSEFRTDICEGSCPLSLALTTTKDVPAPEVLGRATVDGTRHPYADEFRENVLLPAALDPTHPLHSSDPNTIRFSFDDRFHAYESSAASRGGTFDATSVVAGQSGLTAWLQAEMDAAAIPEVTLTASKILARVQTQTCGGCHSDSSMADLGNGVSQPATFDFTHVNERVEAGPDGPRHVMSEGLKTSFLPFRKQVLQAFLAPDSCAVSLGSFDRLDDWSAAGASLSLDNQASEGASSLRLTHSGGQVRVSSRPFVGSAELGPNPGRIDFDLTIPSVQPNPWYWGDVRLELSCPAKHIQNTYIGSTGITGRAANTPVKLSYAFPEWLRSTLAAHPTLECSWTFALSISPGAGDYRLDHLVVQQKAH